MHIANCVGGIVYNNNEPPGCVYRRSSTPDFSIAVVVFFSRYELSHSQYFLFFRVHEYLIDYLQSYM